MDTRLKFAAAALAGALAVAAPGTAAPNKGQDDTLTHTCSNADGKIVYEGPVSMWPPNHKYRELTVTATATDETPQDTMVTLDTAGTHDEYLANDEEMNGAGNTDSDVNPAMAGDMASESAQTAHEVRAERSGRGDGRTYTISALATFDGEPCEVDEEMEEITVDFVIEVPHDMGKRKNG